METIAYGKRWFLAKRRFTESWDESKARIAHEGRKPYAVAIGNGQRVVSVVEAGDDYFGADFLDDLGRSFLSYQFQEIEPARLFLTMATHREFVDDSDQVKCGSTYYFKTDGRITIEMEDLTTGELSRKELQADVSGNWEAYPTFGDYRSLARADR